MEALINGFEFLQQGLYEAIVQPLAVWVGADNLLEQAYEGTGWLLVGILQIVIMLVVMVPIEKIWPAEHWQSRQAVRVDVVYTLIHRLGLFKLVMFFTLENGLDHVWGWMRVQGVPTFHLDQIWPGVTDMAAVSFVLYLVVFDGLHYLIHRAQHAYEPWWALHALHHSQRQMTVWSDNRNHLLDDVITSLIVSVAAVVLGVAPAQFVALVALGQLSESFQHANVKLWFGSVGERLWVSPRFHRLHHSIGLGHETVLAHRTVLGGCNFGVLLPVWDMLFGTANFQYRFDPTGVRDQVEQGRDYGAGFWAQQRLGMLRLIGRA
jgi:sterol desaturase/sphingolipid hydroxylase (fatty acid hydroxylase superfamily)